WNGTILCLSRPFADRDGVADLSAPRPIIGVMAAVTHCSAAAKVRRQLLFQRSARLEDQALVDRLMRHPHTFIVAEFSCKPGATLVRGPFHAQLLCRRASQLRMSGQGAGLR